jgi:head-tail adaptor
MNPGKLDRRMILLRRTVATDQAGSPVETWAAEPSPIWAQRMPATGTETVANGSTRSTVTARYRVVYRSDLVAPAAPGLFRLRVDGRDHDLIAALEDETQPRRSFLMLALAYTQGEPTLTSVPAV